VNFDGILWRGSRVPGRNWRDFCNDSDSFVHSWSVSRILHHYEKAAVLSPLHLARGSICLAEVWDLWSLPVVDVMMCSWMVGWCLVCLPLVLRPPRNLTVMALRESLVRMTWQPQRNADAANYVAVWCKGDASCLVWYYWVSVINCWSIYVFIYQYTLCL